MRSGFLRSGEPFIWLTGGALAACLIMIAGLVIVVATNALGFFWPRDLVTYALKDGSHVMGQRWSEEPEKGRIQLKVGNRDVYGADFRWIEMGDVTKTFVVPAAVAFERREWGDYYGFVEGVYLGDEVVGQGADLWDTLNREIGKAHELHDRIRSLETGELERLDQRIQALKLSQRTSSDPAIESELQETWDKYGTLSNTALRLREEMERVEVAVKTADGRETRIRVADIVRAIQPNGLSTAGKSWVYLSKVWGFVAHEPRESNTEGGVFPAIFGTVMMVFLMSLAAVPFGILAALYLREYAKQGPLVRAIRIAVNNLAGVPSIVFGMFGLGFFVYGVGGTIDQLFYPEKLPAPTYGTGGILWASLTLALLTVPVMIVSAEEALASVTREVREGSLALGATKFQTILRVVLPGALPGILTGIILVIARGAGEVAPLMITGVVKLAPSLPLDAAFPFLHLERKFMHLGFHIYDVGFQSPNVEAARPMVYTTTLLLMVMVLALNLAAIVFRSRVRKRLTGLAV
ncbi:TPA: phosphate ABC transporter permease PtsA [Candidatus Latescibacteria bacterium]|nr:phosphate ABC transporter permease PtsA [Candidatus Latescibacterota bacterium]